MKRLTATSLEFTDDCEPPAGHRAVLTAAGDREESRSRSVAVRPHDEITEDDPFSVCRERRFFRYLRGWLRSSSACRSSRMSFGHGRPCACPSDHVHDLGKGGQQNTLRANGPSICLAQPNGLGIRVPKRTKGPTARPFARVAQSQTYRSSISMPCFSQSRRYSSWKEFVA